MDALGINLLQVMCQNVFFKMHFKISRLIQWVTCSEIYQQLLSENRFKTMSFPFSATIWRQVLNLWFYLTLSYISTEENDIQNTLDTRNLVLNESWPNVTLLHLIEIYTLPLAFERLIFCVHLF